MDPARLACVKHAASVRPEPGSNSPSRSCTAGHEARRLTIWRVGLSTDPAETLLTVVRFSYEVLLRLEPSGKPNGAVARTDF